MNNYRKKGGEPELEGKVQLSFWGLKTKGMEA
jgi:hypothetical protein